MSNSALTRESVLVGVLTAVVVPVHQVSAQQFLGDGSLGYTADAWRVAASGEWGLEVFGGVTLGAGLRLTFYGGDPRSYRNQGTTTPGLPATLSVEPAVWGVNLMVSGQARLQGPVGAGANIDLAGLAVGPSRRSGTASLEPARGSLLLYGNNDRGSLNSEFFVVVTVSGHLQLRGDVSHYVVGYGATDGTSRTRYLRFDSVPFLAARWRF